jgi:hypothetical protein
MILPLTLDRHEQFVQVPGVAQAPLPSPERPGVFDTKLPTPLSDGFVADGDAPLRQKIFHISKAQAESVVEPNSMANDIRWKSISVISGRVGFHRLSLLGSPELDNTRHTVARRKANLCEPTPLENSYAQMPTASLQAATELATSSSTNTDLLIEGEIRPVLLA